MSRDAVTNAFTWDLGPVSVHNATYYGSTRLLFANDWDGTPVPVLDALAPSTDKQFYTETQIYGKLLDRRLDWRAGGVYSDNAGTDGSDSTEFPFPVSITTPGYVRDKSDYKSYALFGQATYDFSDWIKGLSLTAGGRYTWDDRTFQTQNYAGSPTPVCQLQTLPVPVTGPVAYPGTDLATCTRHLALKSANYNYNFTLSWTPIDKLLIYAATRRGYEAGGFNSYTAPGPLAVTLAEFAPETIMDVEVGVKSDWRLGGIPVRANLAVYDSWYNNIQVSQGVVTPSGAAAIVVENVSPTGLPNRATIYGFELEMTAIPVRWLQLTGFYSRVYGTFSQFTTATGLNLAGQNVDGIVPETYGITAVADIPISGPFNDLNVSASYYHGAEPLINASSTTGGSSTTSSVDARIEARNVFHTGATVAVFGKNLSNQMNCNFDLIVSGENTRTCGDPRTYGVELRYPFGGGR